MSDGLVEIAKTLLVGRMNHHAEHYEKGEYCTPQCEKGAALHSEIWSLHGALAPSAEKLDPQDASLPGAVRGNVKLVEALNKIRRERSRQDFWQEAGARL